MGYLNLIFIIFVLLATQGCGPMAAIGAVGNTVTNAAYNKEERRLRSGYISPGQRSAEIADANLYLGVEYMQQGHYDKALEKLNRANTAKSDSAPVHNALGLLHQYMDDNEAAERYFKRAISLKPTDSSSFNNYGLFLCQNQRFDEAEEFFLMAANNPLYDTPEIAITNAGICALSNNQSERAENYFRAALNKNPGVAAALIQMVEFSYNQDNYQSARMYLKRYLEVSRHTAKSLWLGIRIEQELGDMNAVSSYALLLRNIFPGTKEAELLSESGAR